MKTISEIIETATKYHHDLPPLEQPIVFKPPLSKYLDCALHDPAATPDRVKKLCDDAIENHLATVFINPIFVPLVKERLSGSGVHVGTIAGFPLGGYPTEIKVKEASLYLEQGADEIDMVMSVGMLKAGAYQLVMDDVRQVVDTVHASGGLCKVILETCLLDKFEKIIACLICKEAGADFVKTSTGFSTGGATIEDIDLMRRVVGPEDQMGVKAAGGIHVLNDALSMIKAGANRLGTRLAVGILEEYHRGLPID